MVYKSLCLSGLFLLWGSLISAQVVLDLRDKVNGIEIVDAVIEVTSDQGETAYYTSDLFGNAVLMEEVLPISIFIQHLSYERKQLMINEQGRHTIFLEPRNHHLDGMVVTGQYYAQSSKNSVYRVKSIDNAELKTMAATDLSEVMSFSQNVKLDRDQNLNGNYLKFLGLGGNNVKILLDGMPLAGRTALQFDVSQINLSNVEKIEIVEGPMSVEYGSNALAGVVNIITKKHSTLQPTLAIKKQAETIGSQYGWRKGLHDLSVVSNEMLFKKIATTSTLEYKNFGGSKIDHLDSRATEWDPKRQLFGDVKLKSEVKGGELTYRVAYYRDWIENLGPEQGPLKDRALDDHYKSRRWNQHLTYGKFYEKLGRVDAKLSYSDFKRTKNSFVNNLKTNEKVLSTVEGAQDTSVFKNLSFWTHHTKIVSDQLKVKSGFDFQYDYTGGGRILGEGGKSALDAAIFVSAEYALSDKFTIRPGLRWAYNNRFKSPVVPSLNMMLAISDQSTLRGGYAKGFRAPALRELFFEFVDNSHTIFGNPDLTPETSEFVDLSYVYSHRFTTGVKQKISSRFFYSKVDNQITFAQDVNDPSKTTLLNNEIYRAYGFSFNQQLFFESVEFSAGAGFIGTFNQLSNKYSAPHYVYTPEMTAGLKVNIMDTPLRLTTQFKYNGKEPSYILVTPIEGGEPTPELVKSDDYYIMDMFLKYDLSDNICVGAGVKNLFNVQRVRVVNTQNFHAGGGEVPVGYGRSAFLRLNYSFQLNKTK